MLKKLFSQTAVYGMSSIISKFLNYLLTPYFTYTIGRSIFGEVNLYYGIIPFANAFLTMGLTTGYFRFAARCATEREKKELFSTIWTAVSLLSVLFFVVFSQLKGTPLNYTDAQWHMVVVGALIMVDNIKDLPLAALREQGRAKRFMVVNITGVVVNVILCISLYELVPGAKEEPGWALVANLAASVISLAMLLPTALKLYIGKFSKRLFATLTKYSFPLMIAGIMGVASDFIDRQMMFWLLPEEMATSEVGVYSAVAKIAALMFIFRQIYSYGAEPYFLNNFKDDDFKKQNAEALKLFTVVGLLIFLGISLFDDVLAVIIGRDYREGLVILPILTFAYLLSGVLINLSFWYKQVDKTSVAVWVTMVGVIVTIVLNLILIPRYSYEGAAWTRLIATLAMVMMSYILGQIYFRVPYDLKRIALYIILAGSIFTLSYWTESLAPVLRYSLNILLILSYIHIAYKLEWKKLKS